MVWLAPQARAETVPADASQPPQMRLLRVAESPLSKSPQHNDTMSFQAKTTHRTPSSLSHAFSTAVVRDLPSFAGSKRSR
jgi:hypothetical protein